MKVYTEINALPDFHNAVVTIGTFDGVHSGHRQIIDRLKTEAEAIQGENRYHNFSFSPTKDSGLGQYRSSTYHNNSGKNSVAE